MAMAPKPVSASMPPVAITTSSTAAWLAKNIFPVPPPDVTEAVTDMPSHMTSPS